MKILIVHNRYQRPGGEDVVFEQERQLLERNGHEVAVYCRSNDEVDSHTGVQRLVLLRKTIWADDSRREFARLLDLNKPDVVHVHNTFTMISPSIYSACREAGVPVVQTLHNYRLLCPAATFFRQGRVCEECTQHGLWRSIRHGCYRDSRAATATVVMMLTTHRYLHTWDRNVTSYIALSEFSRQKFVENGLPAQKTFVKPNFVYPDPGLGTGDGNYVLFAGRLSPEKSVRTLLNAWGLLPQPIPLVIVGDGPDRVELEKQALSLGLSHVVFRGQLSRQETLDTMRRARFMVLTSELYENFPVAIAESFATGLPVICCKLGAMQEIVDDGRTGLHFTPGDASDLADKVSWAWNHREFVDGLGRSARREFEQKYTAEKNYPLLMNIYQRAQAANPSFQTAQAPLTVRHCVDHQNGD